jgi:tyrosine-protein phosphatase YwqE
MGEFGPQARETALELLSSGHPVVIASDGHDPFRRTPEIRRAVEVAASVVGPEYARQMVTDLPQALLEDRPLRPPCPGIA